jgi:hypothetical protein
MEEKDGRIVKTAVEARGARLGRPVLIVLIVSTLAVIGFPYSITAASAKGELKPGMARVTTP